MLLSIDVGQKNLGVCLLENNGNISRWCVHELNKDTLSTSIINVLDLYKDEVNQCIIEKQPSKNIKMRVIEGMIHMYFTLKQISVISYSAKHKLKDISMNLKGKSNYRERKKQAIKITFNLLKDSNLWESYFKNHKKKDDLADCYLQGLSYLNIQIPNIDIEIKSKEISYNSRKPTLKQL